MRRGRRSGKAQASLSFPFFFFYFFMESIFYFLMPRHDDIQRASMPIFFADARSFFALPSAVW